MMPGVKMEPNVMVHSSVSGNIRSATPAMPGAVLTASPPPEGRDVAETGVVGNLCGMGTFGDRTFGEAEVKDGVCGGECGKDCCGTHAVACTDRKGGGRFHGCGDAKAGEELLNKAGAVTDQRVA